MTADELKARRAWRGKARESKKKTALSKEMPMR